MKNKTSLNIQIFDLNDDLIKNEYMKRSNNIMNDIDRFVYTTLINHVIDTQTTCIDIDDLKMIKYLTKQFNKTINTFLNDAHDAYDEHTNNTYNNEQFTHTIKHNDTSTYIIINYVIFND